MDRRTAISRIGIMLGGTLSASTLSALVSGCAAPSADDYTPKFLSPAQLERVARLADVIIPDTDTPGARAAGVHRFIDTLLAEYYPSAEARNFLALFDAFDMMHDIDSHSDDELQTLLTTIDADWTAGKDDPVWKQIKEWTISGYYTSEIGMTQELRLKPYVTARMDMPRSEVERTWAE
jgi:gluconate 2-dehydrogenase gamma chain